MKKPVAFLLILTTVFLCGCNLVDGIFDYSTDKMIESLDEENVFYQLPHAQTGVTVELDPSVEQPYEVTDIIINDEKYVATEHYASKQARRIKPIANYVEHHTFYELESDSGIYVIADNINLKIFVKPEDSERFAEYYGDGINYNYLCLDENDDVIPIVLDNEIISTIMSEREQIFYRSNGVVSGFASFCDGGYVYLDSYDRAYSVMMQSKDWLTETQLGSVYIIEKDGVFYCDGYDFYSDEDPIAVLTLSDEYQQYFREKLNR